MNIDHIKAPVLEEVFQISISVNEPIVVGQDLENGRRQLIEITDGDVSGPFFKGRVMSGGVDSQIIRNNGKCELSARYAILLDDGAAIYIQNDGIRTVPQKYIQDIKAGKFVDPSLYYFMTIPKIETYDQKYKWLEDNIFICNATRLPDKVLLKFYKVGKGN